MFSEDSYQRLLANRSFLALWLGQGMDSLGQAILYVTLALYVYDLTGSAREVSLAVALELLPWVVVSPIAGILVDRVNRKFLLVGGYISQAGLLALLPFTSSLGQMYLLIFLSSLPVPVYQITRVAFCDRHWPSHGSGRSRLVVDYQGYRAIAEVRPE